MMTALWHNLKFEFTSRKRFLSPYLFWLLLTSLSFIMTLAAGGALGGHVSFGLGQKVMINSPFGISVIYGLLFFFGVLIITPIFGQAVCKDFENKFDPIIFATPAHRTGFYLGRFLGATLISLLLFSGLGLGVAIASISPWVQASLFGNSRFLAYILPYLTLILPNIIIVGGLGFAVGSFAKRMAPVYVMGILFFMGYLFSSSLGSEIELKTLRAMLDPFGMNSLGVLTEYWSVAEQNQKLLPLTGVFLWNRLAWLTLGLAGLAIGLVFVQKPQKRKAEKKKSKLEPIAETLAPEPKTVRETFKATAPLSFDAGSQLKLLKTQTLFEAKSALKNIYFLCMALAGAIFVIVNSINSGKIFGTETYPVTWKVLQAASGSFSIFTMMILVFYTGELIWRDRNNRSDQIIDAMPTSLWLPPFAKFLGMQVIIACLYALIAVLVVLLQISQGYFRFEWNQILYTLFTVEYVNTLLYSTLFFLIHTLANNKYLGHGISILYLILATYIPSLGYERLLYRFPGGTGGVFYSDMNGYGSALLRTRNFQVYWGIFSALVLLLTYVFWVRGTDGSWRSRWRDSLRRWNRPLAALAVIFVLGFAAQGSWIYYNTEVVNKYSSSKDDEKDAEYYERTYKAAYGDQPVLRITDVKAKVDIFPSQLALKAGMNYTFENKETVPVETMFVVMPFEKKHFTFSFDRAADLIKDDERVNVLIYKFQKPVLPGEKVVLDLGLDYKVEGFRNGRDPTFLVANGTFFNNGQPFPSFAYQDSLELSTDKDREKHGLAPKPRMNSIDDEKARQNNYLTKKESDWITFEAVVSTDADQIAIAPGYLQKEWRDGDRHYFEYKMDQKILNFYSFLSACYEVKRDKWKDVAIEVYYHKGHEYNLDTMIAASKAGLDYYSENFGPYQHKQFRIVEFPRFASFAQSFPNTIPYSESIGFIAKIDPKSDDVDYPYDVTAHELAHQWWAHQVIGADVQGATLLSETLSQYSAMMVLEKKYGREKMGRYLKHEMDTYLRARSTETKIEQPLALNENQSYIHYNKGSVSMFALKEIVGEKALNAALKVYLEKVKYQTAPYTTSKDFIATLKENLDPKFHDEIDDLLSKITLYDNRITKAETKLEADGKTQVTLAIKGRKIYADGKGDEVDAPLDQEFSITLRDKDDKILSEEKARIKTGENEITLHVAKKPAKVSLDDLGIWIDKVRDDNKVKL